MPNLIGNGPNQVPVNSMLGSMAFMDKDIAFRGTSYKQRDDDSLGSGTHTFNFSKGDMQKLTATGNITIAFSGFVPGRVSVMIIDAVNWGNYAITHPTGMEFSDGAAPVYTANGTDRLQIIKDADDVYFLSIIGTNIGTV